MTPVHQEILCSRRGDCVRACFATLLDLLAAPAGPRPLGDAHARPVRSRGEEYDARYVIASGPSMMFQGSKHVVVAERYRFDDDGPDGPWRARFVHDPNPSGKFIAHAESYMHLVRRAA